MSGLKSSERQFRRNHAQPARAQHVHSVFEDAGCDIASHHRCTSVAPLCSCDPALSGETAHECSCGHTHVRPRLSGTREAKFSIEGMSGVL